MKTGRGYPIRRRVPKKKQIVEGRRPSVALMLQSYFLWTLFHFFYVAPLYSNS